MKFSNKQALIVGGSSGMGLETGKLLVEEGGSVTLVGRQQEKLDAARDTFEKTNKVSTFRCDLTTKKNVDKLIQHIAKEMKDVKCLCSASGDHMIMVECWFKHSKELSDFLKNLKTMDGVKKICPPERITGIRSWWFVTSRPGRSATWRPIWK